MVTVCDFVAPTVTLPKSSVEGLSASSPVPFPERATVCVPLEASLLTERVAVNAAAAFGVNEILRVVLCPAGSDRGNVELCTVKYLVETDALPSATALLPELVSINERVLVVFGDTFPKLRLALPRASVP